MKVWILYRRDFAPYDPGETSVRALVKTENPVPYRGERRAFTRTCYLNIYLAAWTELEGSTVTVTPRNQGGDLLPHYSSTGTPPIGQYELEEKFWSIRKYLERLGMEVIE